MSIPSAQKVLCSFDGSEAIPSTVFAPDRYRILEEVFLTARHLSVQGAGLSYAPLSFGASQPDSAVLQMRQWNRFLSFDAQSGVVEVEAGMSLGELAEFSVPKGWYLKVQPGHPSITVGGCLCSDVHGKNQFQDGNFREQVLFLRIFHPRKGFIYCDRTDNNELFELTCGGYGLTGVVLSVGLQLGKLSSTEILSEVHLIEDISELPALLREHGKTDDLLYSWHDLNLKKKWGSGFLITGRSIGSSDLNMRPKVFSSRWSELRSDRRGQKFGNLMNSFSVKLMNKAYSVQQLSFSSKKHIDLVEFLFPVLNKTFYFDLFGGKGFHETQILIPDGQFKELIKELEKKRFEFNLPITLASAKLFNGGQQLLRFNGNGIVLALNFPRSAESLRFLSWWDDLTCELGCLPNLTKDSRLPVGVVEKCYLEYELFKTKLMNWDSDRIFQTAFSQRLQL